MCSSDLTLAIINNLAHVLKAQDNAKEALTLIKECLQVRSRVLGLDHPDTLSSLESYNSWEMEVTSL